MTDPLVNFDCPRCGQNLEASEFNAGKSLPCPSCSASIIIPVPAVRKTVSVPARKQIRVSSSVQQDQSAPTTAPVVSAYPRKTVERVGVGCLLQGIGVTACVFAFMVGSPFLWLVLCVLGIILLLAGARAAIKFDCSACGNRLASAEVRLCPVCRVPLGTKPQSNVVAVIFVLLLLAALLWTVYQLAK